MALNLGRRISPMGRKRRLSVGSADISAVLLLENRLIAERWAMRRVAPVVLFQDFIGKPGPG